MSKLDLVQSEAVEKTYSTLKKSGKALLRMAVGTGKTETAIKLFERMDTENSSRLLWITHTNELVEQAAERFILRALARSNGDGLDVGVFNARIKETHTKIVVASIQTLTKNRSLKQFSPTDFDIIVVDEAHHSPAETWLKVIKYFDGYKLGLTATPFRPDSKPLGEYFGEISFDLPFKKAQDEGLVAQDKNVVVITDSFLNGMVSGNGEYSAKQLDKLFTSQKRNETVVKAYRKYARSSVIESGMRPKSICFCINIQHAIRMTKYFRKNEISSEFLCGDSARLSAEDRSNIMNKFKNTNEIEILCVVNILNEGVDIADCNILLMTRPTQSNIVYQQQIGRASRIDSGKKKFFYIMDFVDQTDTDFQSYTMSTLKSVPLTKSQVITEYIDDQDEVQIEKTTKDIMEKAMNFEVDMRKTLDASKINEENLKKFIATNGEFQPWNV